MASVGQGAQRGPDAFQLADLLVDLGEPRLDDPFDLGAGTIAILVKGQEFGDFGVALNKLDQSFSYEIKVCDGCEIAASYIDNYATLQDPVDAPPACLVIDVDPGSEDGTLPSPSGQFP